MPGSCAAASATGTRRATRTSSRSSDAYATRTRAAHILRRHGGRAPGPPETTRLARFSERATAETKGPRIRPGALTAASSRGSLRILRLLPARILLFLAARHLSADG